MFNSRAYAAQILTRVIQENIYLDEALQNAFSDNNADRAFIQELCYGTLRFYWRLNFLAKQLLKKPFCGDQLEVQILILIGLYQLLYLDTPPYAALSSTVEATKQLNKVWAAKVINGVLRNFERQREALLIKAKDDLVARTAHPLWLIKKIRATYPKHWKAIYEANNQKPPLTLRVNVQQTDYKKMLEMFSAQLLNVRKGDLVNTSLYLKAPLVVSKILGFLEGKLSVQDEAAQLAAVLLDVHPYQIVLDACAAPGGKTAHILEMEPTVKLTAIEISSYRAKKIGENLRRLKLQAEIKVADASKPNTWWEGSLFDRILLDAPCSATGVIRRHPDIKVLRQPEEISLLVGTQSKLLNALWPLLKKEGLFLYATCSILPEENREQIQKFLATHHDAELNSIKHHFKKDVWPDWQLLPNSTGTDGFYYALLKKK